MKQIKLAKINPEIVSEEIGEFMLKEITSIGYTGGVIGLSGGIDSTTTAALGKNTFEKYNSNNPKKEKLELVGYILPSSVNNVKDTEDGIRVAKRLGIRYEVIEIDPLVRAFKEINPGTLESQFLKGNLISEIRALVLHSKSALEKKLVLGTGNRDEDFGVGYYTLFGDGAVHLSPIGNLPKRLVREMANYLGFGDMAYRIPTAGLEPGQTDFKDLGYEYDFVELVSEGILQGFGLDELKNHPQVIVLGETQLKKYEEVHGTKKFSRIQEIVEDLFKRNKVAKKKASIVSAPVAKVTLNYD